MWCGVGTSNELRGSLLERSAREGDSPVLVSFEDESDCPRVWRVESRVRIWEPSTPNPKYFLKPIVNSIKDKTREDKTWDAITGCWKK